MALRDATGTLLLVSCIIISVMLLLGDHHVAADLPVHCLNLHVAGGWILSLSSPGDNTDISCGYAAPDSNRQHWVNTSVFDFTVSSTYEVVLVRPDVAYDSEGNVGYWTMVYDEGFELRIGGRVFFAFMSYSPKDGVDPLTTDDITNYISNCDATRTGWYHNTDETQWGCWSGLKYTQGITTTASNALQVESVFAWADQDDLVNHGYNGESSITSNAAVVSPSSKSAVHSRVFKADHTFVDRHNSDRSKTWKAKVHTKMEGKRLSHLFGLGSKFQNVKTPTTSTSTKTLAKKTMVHKRTKKNTHSRRVSVHSSNLTTADFPESFDWRNVNGINYISAVVDQGSCGSCYAVATMDAVNARFRIASNLTLAPYLSAEEIISCLRTTQGCDGGYPYLVSKSGHEHGYVTNDVFTYSGKETACPDLSSAQRWYLSDYGYVGGYRGATSEVTMMQEIYTNGPIVVAFESPVSLSYYSSGIFNGECTSLDESEESDVIHDWQEVNHAVTAVGWGQENGMAYWIIKNTWGSWWGEHGYFRIARGTNECAIESLAVWSRPQLDAALYSS